MTTPGGLHERRRLRDMRRVQHHAVELFEQEGFSDVTVERVAAAADVSPVSVYRWFGTKERLVLWDDYDPGLLAAVADRLADRPPLAAVRDAVIAELGQVYDADRELVLARTRLVHREPALLAAASLDMRQLQAALAERFAAADATTDPFDRQVLAAVAVGVLTAAVEAWQREDGRLPLADFVEAGFDTAGRSSWAT